MKISLDNNHSIFIVGAIVFLASLAAAIYTHYYVFLLVPFGLISFLFGWRNLLIPFLLLIASIPFSIEYQYSPALGTDLPDEVLMWLVTVLVVFYLVYLSAKPNPEIIRHPIIICLIVVLAWSIVSSINSTFPTLSIKYLLAKSWYIGAFIGAALIIFRSKTSMVITIVTLAVAMILVVLITLVRHAGQRFSFSAINDALFPFFRNHVNYSALLVCIYPILGSFYIFAKRRPQKVLVFFLVILMSTALFFSYSRGAWLALIVGTVSWWFIKKKLLIKAIVITLVIIVISSFWLLKDNNYLRFAHNYQKTIFHENFQEHLIATYQLRDLSTAERFYRWVAATKMVEAKPILGFGPNTFYQNYKPYAAPAFKTWVSDNPEHSTVHNYFLLTLTEQGYPGLFFLLILCFGVIYYAQLIYQRRGDLFYRMIAIAAGSVFMMILTVNLLSDLIETDKIGSIFFLCISAIITADIKTRNPVDGSDSTTHIQSIP